MVGSLGPMDLEALRGFLAVVETGSFVSAATSLRWARATLRRRVDELEAMAGVPLLRRSGQGAEPTEAGRALAARGKEILAEASSLLSSVREVGAHPAGVVRVAVPVGLPPEILQPMYALLRARHPKLSVVLTPWDDPLKALVHDVDVALCFGDRPPEGPWVTRELAKLEERLVATPEYLASRGTPRRLEELAGHDLLVWPAPGEREPRLALRDGGSFLASPTLVSPDIHFLRQCGSAGLGIVYAPDGALPGDATRWVRVLDDVVGGRRSLRVVLPAALTDIPRIRAVLELAEELLPPSLSRRPRRGSP